MAFGNGPKVVTSGLVLALDAADRNSYPGSGTTWRDMSGNNRNATLVNGPSFSNIDNGAVVFDGTDDSLSFSTITFSNTSYTLEMFSNITGILDTSNRRSVFGNINYASEFSNTTTFFTNLTVNSVDTYFNFGFSTAGSLVIGQDFHWVFTLDFSTKNVFIYLNGRSITSADTQLTSYTNISTTFTRFGIWTTIRPYIGNLYSARMYNKYLTSSEVLQNYNALKSRFNL